MPKKSKKTKKVVTKSAGYSRANMLKEQEAFYKAHPNAKPLIFSFMILALLLGFLYYVNYGFALMY